jgi:hypothetical protein
MEMAPAQRAREGGASKDLLRFITCGSVDDGKSTLIGRLLHDSKLIFEDQLSALRQDSERLVREAEGSISPCCSTGSKPNANRASPSMWLTGSLQPRAARSSWLIRRAMNTTRATWRPVRPPRSSR